MIFLLLCAKKTNLVTKIRFKNKFRAVILSFCTGQKKYHFIMKFDTYVQICIPNYFTTFLKCFMSLGGKVDFRMNWPVPRMARTKFWSLRVRLNDHINHSYLTLRVLCMTSACATLATWWSAPAPYPLTWSVYLLYFTCVWDRKSTRLNSSHRR